jgi:hypothetical protein
MSVNYPVFTPHPPRAPKPQSNHFGTPHSHILIAAWSALVVLYGEPG